MAAKKDKTEKTKSNKEESNNAEEKIEGVENSGNDSRQNPETKDSQEESGDTMTQEESSPAEKLAEMHDRYLRLSAEFDNYRKRTLKEKIELSRSAAESVMVGMLPLMDDFERGLAHIDADGGTGALREGIELIYSKFRNFLEQNGVKEIEALNSEFDVDLHDAVTKIAVTDKKMKGKVVDVIQKGYTLNEKVIRFSKVVVGE